MIISSRGILFSPVRKSSTHSSFPTSMQKERRIIEIIKRGKKIETRGYSQCSISNNRKVIVFPGQGSQYVGMMKEIWKEYSLVRESMEEMNESIDFSLQKLLFEGPQEKLTQTQFAQPAILAHSTCIFNLLKSEGLFDNNNIVYTMGHSLGEFSALVASQVISPKDAIDLVHWRGKWMQECIDPSESSMVAFLFITHQEAKRLAHMASLQSGQICQVANINSPQQVVLSGHKIALEAAIALAGDINTFGKRIKGKMLNVSAPFHSSLMLPSSIKLSTKLASIDLKDPIIPIISNVNAQPVNDKESLRKLLVEQVTSPVLWNDMVHFCSNNKEIGEFIEIGPGKVLINLIKQINPTIKCTSIDSLKDLQAFLSLTTNNKDKIID